MVIRADGNNTIGFGHLVRTQALAQQLIKRGAKVIFLTRNPEFIKAFPVEAIDNRVDFHTEDGMVEAKLQQYGADLLIVDSYNYDQDRLDRIGQLDLLTVYIDDLNSYLFNIDYVVNGNLYAPHVDYQGRAQSLLGSQYLLLREDFNDLSARKVRPQVKDILITFGAADMENVTPKVLEMLGGYSYFAEISWHVVIGPVFKYSKEIEFVTQGISNVYTYHSPNIKNLMDNCDICISAAGSTSYELAACGVPAVLIVAGDNQICLAQEAGRLGIAINIGWYNHIQSIDLYQALDQLIMNCEVRQEMVNRGQELIDAKGAERVAEFLLAAMQKKKSG